MPTFSPTPEQQAILDAFESDPRSIMVQAYAGAVKSTTLELLSRKTRGSALALAFNKKIATELQRRFPPNVEIKTLNGLGHAIWSATIGRRLTVDERKVGRLVSGLAKDQGVQLPNDSWSTVVAVVGAAQTYGLIASGEGRNHHEVLSDTTESWLQLADLKYVELPEDLIPFCRQVLRLAVEESFQGTISFDDQIYMSALFTRAYPKYPLVFVDEAQDLSELNRLLVAGVAAKRLVIVGDQLQSLYAFRGADHNSMDNLKGLRPEWLELPLTTTFRCPKVVVQRQLVHAPGFNAFESNPEGTFLEWKPDHKQWADNNPAWTWEQLQVTAAGAPIAILCRNNAPLFSIAFRLIRQGVGVMMLGRDIGKGLVSLANKILPDDKTPQPACLAAVERWKQVESAKARDSGKDFRLGPIDDKSGCLEAVLESVGVAHAGDLKSRIRELFDKSTGQVTLASIHRAKGLEWDTVLLLDPWRIPSKSALRAGGAALQQELNARYVAETRSKRVLIHANLEDFQ